MYIIRKINTGFRYEPVYRPALTLSAEFKIVGDVVALLLTGFGKSFIFQPLPIFS